MALKLSPREISRQLANSNLTRSDCALLRPMAVKSSFSIQELTACDYPKMVSRPKCYFPLAVNCLNKAEKLDLGVGVTHTGGFRCASSPLPSLRVNNSNEGACEDVTAVGSAVPVVPNTPPPAYVRKKEFSLKCNIMALCEAYPIGHIGFFTLTYSDNQQSFRDAAKDFNSLATGVLNDRFLAWVKVGERTKKGVVHFHLLVVCKQEIRRGFDFDAVKNRNYQSASAYIRNEWAFWSSRAARGKKPARVGAAERYGFGGRVELLPIRKNAEALASYLSKYLSKGFVNRRQDDKGVRLISYIPIQPEGTGIVIV